MASAAARPSAHAEMMLPGSTTTSPPAYTPAGPAERVAPSTSTPPPACRVTRLPSRNASSGSWPTATTTESQATMNSLPGMGTGDRRPSGSGVAQRVAHAPDADDATAFPEDLHRRHQLLEDVALLERAVELLLVRRHLAAAFAGRAA